LDIGRPASNFGRVFLLLLGVGLFALGGLVLFTVSPFGLLLALLGLAVASLGIFPAKTVKIENRRDESTGGRRSSSITFFRIVFVTMVLGLVEFVLVRNLLLIIVTWLPVTAWIVREVRKTLPVKS
jgi:hypothetical protein